MKYKIEDKDVGVRLDKFLTENLSGLSRSQIQKLIKDKSITVNGDVMTKHHLLKEGDEVVISDQKSVIRKDENDLLNKIKVISEDNDYLVIDKPAGLLVHPVKSSKAGILPKAKLFDRVNPTENSTEKTLVDWLIKKYPKIKNVKDPIHVKSLRDHVARPGIVHRLDRDVSGLMIIAKTQDMFDNLKQQFQSRKINKEYTALVYGKIELDEGEITRSITRSKKTGLMIARGSNQEQGKNAITKFEVLKRLPRQKLSHLGGQANYTLLKIKLITGRTHQIRVHLRSIGHSVVGDTLYQTRNLKKRKLKSELGRIFLCATKLGFYDLNNDWQEFSIDLPEELTGFLDSVK